MPAVLFRMSFALGVGAALINLLAWNEPVMAMAAGHTLEFKALYSIWFVTGWGVGSGALMSVVIAAIRQCSAGRLAAVIAFFAATTITSVLCAVLYRGLTDMQFMQDAM